MNDILISRYEGRVKRGWNLGQRIRIGDPFVSREEEQQPWYKEGYEAPLIMEWLSHYDEKYTTPENIKTNDLKY